ncbi:MAG: PAC2 family protein [Dehalococcoidia bacterium]|nr:PAC2 family protein [Dehalococcoidia bacterium]MSQ15965.1 PAC2 family protein [Dehalococcoidia bacterium]
MKIGAFEVTGPAPELKEPHALAVLRPWIDVGNVGSLSLSRLERNLRATEVGRLAQPGHFYDFTRYRPRSYFDQGARKLSVPNTIVRCAVRETGPDLVFIHLLEPHLYGEDYVDSMLEMLNFLGVRRYSLVGAMYDMVPHTRPLLVSGLASTPQGHEENRTLGANPSTYEGPTTITFMIPQRGAQAGMETRGFVVHLPQYLQVDEDFRGTARLTEILCKLYNLPDWLIEQERGVQQYETLQKTVSETSGAGPLLQQLEERYDRDQRESQPPPNLSTNMQEFLEDMGRGLDRPPESGS